jgi:hypothetical protein
MKRMVLAMVMVGVFCSIGFSMPLTYKQKINLMAGVDTSTAVTIQARLQWGLKDVAANILQGNTGYNYTDLANNTLFTQGQLTEWCLRAIRGAVDQYMIPMLLGDPAIYNNTVSATDNQIKTSIENDIYAYAKTL